MTPEIGHFCLILALFIAASLAVVPMIGVARGVRVYMDYAHSASLGLGLFVSLAFACLMASFINNDFSVLNVASNSNSALPLQYRIAATWGSHEGSILLWTLMLALWTLAVSSLSRKLPVDMVARVLAVMGVLSTGFLAFMLLTSNPFDRLIPAAPDGRDLNPLLQDPGMVIHPPMLYMGYVGFSVAFAFAIAALMSGRLDASWARWSRPWTTVAWIFLTIGIALGSFWAYYELGWGGWWFWDPVENASFMPWLVGTALIHSLALTEKRGTFKAWTVLLAITAFSLSLLGTFLVRSGILSSVHAFATDPKRGAFILAFLAVVVGGSLLLFAWRGAALRSKGGYELFSRESLLLANNVLLAVAMAAVMLGTLYPLVLDGLGLGKISVGPPYFETVFVPLLTPLLILIGIGPLVRWKQDDLKAVLAKLRWPLAISVVAAAALPFVMGHWTPMVSFGLLMGVWVIASSLNSLFLMAAKNAAGRNPLPRLTLIPRAVYAMTLAHIGLGVFVLGVTLVRGYQTEQDVELRPGQTLPLGRYEVRFDGVNRVRGPNYDAMAGKFTLQKGGASVATMSTEKRLYRVQQNPMTEAAIDRGFTRDVYIALGEDLGNGAWTARLYLKPFINWIWIGALLMALGGLLAVSDRRYRIRLRESAPDPVPAPATAPVGTTTTGAA
jgi:cytochrome c-type biogenesis protein CcmF